MSCLLYIKETVLYKLILRENIFKKIGKTLACNDQLSKMKILKNEMTVYMSFTIQTSV